MMTKPQWLTAQVVGSGAGNQHALLPADKRFELTLNLTTVPGFRRFTHRDIKDGSTMNLVAVYSDVGFGSYILVDADYDALKARYT